jgi:hypothetical protein
MLAVGMTDLAFAHLGGVAMPKTLIRTLVIGALSLIYGNAHAQTPVAGGHNIPRMVEGEALKPNGSFYLGGYSGPETSRHTGSISTTFEANETLPISSRIGCLGPFA